MTVVASELTGSQLPLWITALKWVVTVNGPDVYVADVAPSIADQLVPSTDDSHLVTSPVFPLRVSRPLVLPVQIIVPPLTVPPTFSGSTVIFTEAEFTTLHTPL